MLLSQLARAGGYLRGRDAGRGARAHRRAADARPGAAYRVQAFRRAAREISRVPDDGAAAPRRRGPPHRPPRRRRQDRGRDRRGARAARRPQYLEKLLGDDARARAPTPARRCARSSRAICTCTPTGPTAATRSRRWPSKARDLGHEYFALTDHSPRLKIAHGLSAERLREQLDVVAAAQRRARAVPHPHRHRGRHPRRRRARPARGAARARRRRGRERALEAAHGGRRDDAADGRRDREPARRRARPLHRPAARRAGPPGVGVRRRRGDRGVPRSSTPRSRSTAGPSGSTRRSGSCAKAVEAGLKDRDQHRRARDRAARVAAVRHRPRRRVRRDCRPGRQRDAGRRAARVVRLAPDAVTDAVRRVLCDFRGTLFDDEDDTAWIRSAAASIGRDLDRRRDRGDPRAARARRRRDPEIAAALGRCDTSLEVAPRRQPRVVRARRASMTSSRSRSGRATVTRTRRSAFADAAPVMAALQRARSRMSRS